MGTFATTDKNSTDIDPDALTVNLSGTGPDSDDLVKEPQNVRLSDIEPTDLDSEADESIDRIIGAQYTSVEPEVSLSPSTEDEEEINAIEDMLRTKKSARIRKQKIAEKQDQPEGSNSRRKIDPIVVVSAIVAAALIFVFAAYFAGLFDTSNSLKMSLGEFTSAYSKTNSYKAISRYGFAFPAVTYEDDTIASDASAAATVSDVRSFSATVDNTINYQVYISGSVNKADDNIKDMQVVLLLSDLSAFKDALVVYAPYVQVLYPEMSLEEATAFLTTLYDSSDPVTKKGSCGLYIDSGTTGGVNFCTLYIMTAADADTFAARSATAADAAADTTTAAATTQAS